MEHVVNAAAYEEDEKELDKAFAGQVETLEEGAVLLKAAMDERGLGEEVWIFVDPAFMELRVEVSAFALAKLLGIADEPYRTDSD